MLICYENAGIKLAWYNLKEVGLSFYLPQKIFMELRFEVNTSNSTLALETIGWMVAEHSGPHLWLMFLFLGIFLFLVLVLGCSNETPRSPTQFRALWFGSLRETPSSEGWRGARLWGASSLHQPRFQTLHLFSCLEDDSNRTYLCIFNTYAQFFEDF